MQEKLLKNEEHVSASRILEEIEPLIRTYFVGKISFGGGGITYKLPNGQTFLIMTEEVN